MERLDVDGKCRKRREEPEQKKKKATFLSHQGERGGGGGGKVEILRHVTVGGGPSYANQGRGRKGGDVKERKGVRVDMI